MKAYKPILLFGGTSEERRVSVATAQNVATALKKATLWYVNPKGQIFTPSNEELFSHKNPFVEDFVPKGVCLADSFEVAIRENKAVDSVFYFGLHGGEGENGELQAILEKKHIPFTGTGSRASHLAFDKILSKEVAEKHSVPIANGAGFLSDDAGLLDFLQARLVKYGPQIVKPVDGGSSFGVFFLREPGDLEETALSLKKMGSRKYLAESIIVGRELTVGVLEEGTRKFALPASEVRVEQNRSFDYEGKYLGKGTKEITPAEISEKEMQAAQDVALRMHNALGCYGYSRTDMILTPKGPFYLETNTLPGLTKASFIPQQLEAAKIPFQRFIDTQIELALKRYC